jgi:hypothetical protein
LGWFDEVREFRVDNEGEGSIQVNCHTSSTLIPNIVFQKFNDCSLRFFFAQRNLFVKHAGLTSLDWEEDDTGNPIREEAQPFGTEPSSATNSSHHVTTSKKSQAGETGDSNAVQVQGQNDQGLEELWTTKTTNTNALRSGSRKRSDFFSRIRKEVVSSEESDTRLADSEEEDPVTDPDEEAEKREMDTRMPVFTPIDVWEIFCYAGVRC